VTDDAVQDWQSYCMSQEWKPNWDACLTALIADPEAALPR
jgi:hypothetical protein